MSSKAGRPADHVARVGRKDAKPDREVPRPALGASDMSLSAPGPLTIPGPGEQFARPAAQEGRPVLHGAADAVQGAPLAPPPPEARDGLQLGVDAAGGYTVPKQLDGDKPKKPRRH